MIATDTSVWAPQRKRIREELKRRKLSQAWLARNIGVTQKHMSQMLTGKADGRLELWVNMAAALGMHWELRPLNPPEPDREMVQQYLNPPDPK